jgi:hypothetical protein
MEQFRISSPAFQPNGTVPAEQVFDGWGCKGKNISPALRWSGAPAGTKSFALTVCDPARRLAPPGTVHGRNDYGSIGYGGPCPPQGDKSHRYVFTLFALKVPRLDVDASASAAVIGFNLNANVLEKTSVTAYYGR